MASHGAANPRLVHNEGYAETAMNDEESFGECVCVCVCMFMCGCVSASEDGTRRTTNVLLLLLLGPAACLH